MQFIILDELAIGHSFITLIVVDRHSSNLLLSNSYVLHWCHVPWGKFVACTLSIAFSKMAYLENVHATESLSLMVQSGWATRTKWLLVNVSCTKSGSFHWSTLRPNVLQPGYLYHFFFFFFFWERHVTASQCHVGELTEKNGECPALHFLHVQQYCGH